MSQQQGIVKGDTVQKFGSLAFIIGSVLLIVFNALSIADVGPDNVRRLLAGFFVSVGIWGVMLGVAAIHRSITAAGAGWARLGFYFIIVGTAVWTVLMGLAAGIARAAAEGLTDGVAALEVVRYQIQAMAVLSVWLGFFFVGIGMVRSTVYPKWQGWTGLILGILTFALAGVPRFFLGEGSVGDVLFGPLAGLTTIWGVIIGIWIARRAW